MLTIGNDGRRSGKPTSQTFCEPQVDLWHLLRWNFGNENVAAHSESPIEKSQKFLAACMTSQSELWLFGPLIAEEGTVVGIESANRGVLVDHW